MTSTRFDLTPFLGHDEGQHFDRKSLFDGRNGSMRARDRKTVRDQVAEYVAAFANAEGGVLVLGIEDDGAITGHALPPRALDSLMATPRTRLLPAQPEGFVVEVQGKAVVVYDVPASDVPVQVIGDGFPLRMGDQTVQASESQITALKFRGLAESWEARPSLLSVADLDRTLLARARTGAGYAHLTDDEYLLKRKLADRRGAGIVLRRAAELLFAKLGPDHPNAGVRVFRVVGGERRFGVEHNVEELPRIEGNLATVLDEAFGVIGGLIRRPSRLRGTRFQPVPEYPEFCWKEAVLNAVAHRDYSVEGRTTEVWFFDDRMEVASPGGLSPDVSLDDLLRGERRHVSRNPRIVRALVDVGAMRDQGEGIPRMFAEMAGQFLPEPAIAASPRDFQVTLRNTPTLTVEDRDFVAQLGDVELNDAEFRVLLEVYRAGEVNNARLRGMLGLDTHASSVLLRRLRDRGLLRHRGGGTSSYYVLPEPLQMRAPTAPTGDRGEAGSDRGEAGADRGGLGPDRGGLDTPAPSASRRTDTQRRLGIELPSRVQSMLDRLGDRPRQDKLREVIVELCAVRPMTPSELGLLLHRRHDKLVERHLSPMVEEGRLRRAMEPASHPDQAYGTLARRDDLSLFGDEP